MNAPETFRRQALPSASAIDAAIERDSRELAQTLGDFRSALTHAASQAKHPATLQDAPHPHPRPHRLRAPALIAAALTVVASLASLPLWHHASPHLHAAAAPRPAAVANIDDAALLNQIDAELSTNVPDSLAPLTQFASTQFSTTNTHISRIEPEKNNATQE